MNPACERTELQLPAYVSGELPEAEAAQIRAHLETCAACEELAASLHLLHGAMAMSPLPDKLEASRRATIAQKHREAVVRERKRVFSKILQHPKFPAMRLPWLMPLARVALFIVLPTALFLLMLLPGGMSAKRSSHAIEFLSAESPVAALEMDNPLGRAAAEQEQRHTAIPAEKPAAPATPTIVHRYNEKLVENNAVAVGGAAASQFAHSGNRTDQWDESDKRAATKSESSTANFFAYTVPPPAPPPQPAATIAPGVVTVAEPAKPAETTRGLAKVDKLERSEDIAKLADVAFATTDAEKPLVMKGLYKGRSSGGRDSQREAVRSDAVALGLDLATAEPADAASPVDLHGYFQKSAKDGRDEVRGKVDGTQRENLAWYSGDAIAGEDEATKYNVAFGATAAGQGGGGSVPASGPAGAKQLQTWDFAGAADAGVAAGEAVSLGRPVAAAATAGKSVQLGNNKSATAGDEVGRLLAETDAKKSDRDHDADGLKDVSEFGIAKTGESALKEQQNLYFDSSGGQQPARTLALTKAGAGTLSLHGAATYSGVTTINAGTLVASYGTTPAAQSGQKEAELNQNMTGLGAIAGNVAVVPPQVALPTEAANERFGVLAKGEKKTEEFLAAPVGGVTVGGALLTDANGLAPNQAALGDLSKKMDQSYAERRKQRVLESARGKEQVALGYGGGANFIGMEGGLADATPTPAEEKPQPMEKLKTEYPKPMFVGTPVPIKLPNLESPSPRGTVASAYANGAYPATREYSVPKSTMDRFDAKDGYAKFDDYLIAEGVKIPPGAKASYDPETQKLVISARPDTLEVFDKAVSGLAPDARAIGKTIPSQTMQQKLEATIIPEIDFRAANISDVAQFLSEAVKQADPKNVNFNVDASALGQRGESAPNITLNLRHVSAANAIKYISEVAGLTAQVDGNTVALKPQTLVLGSLITRLYPVNKAALGSTTNSEALKSLFEKSGVSFPAGTSIQYNPQNEKLVVANTPDNLEKLEQALVTIQSEPVRPAPPRKPAGFNPYIEAKEDSFSTFGIDVDTASYTLTRRALEGGNWPDPEQVRTEEIVNSFDYDYATPANGAFAIHTQIAPSPFRAPLELLKIGIRGRVIGRDAKKSASLTLVIDTSGSMDSADRLGRIRPALRMLAHQLKPNDTVAIVAFNNTARLLLDRTRGENKKAILAAIDSLAANGSTQLEGGMKLGYEVAARGFVSGGANRVVLMSDGVANLGAATAEAILKTVEQYRNQGIYLTVLGFGSGNYDDAMLMNLADKGDGMYAFVDSDDEAKRLLVEQWEQTLHVIAKDVKIQVEFNPDRVKRWRQIGYEKRHLKREDFRNDAIDAGEVGSGQSVTALYDVELVRSDGFQPSLENAAGTDARPPIATVRVRYKDPDTGRVTELEQRVTDLNRTSDFSLTPARFRVAACAAEFAELLRVSPYTAGTDMNAVAQILRPAATELRLDQKVQELLRLVQTAGGLAK